MGSCKVKLKNIIERYSPPLLGRYLSYIPYEIKLGKNYGKAKKDVAAFALLSPEAKRGQIFQSVKNAVSNAHRVNKFYRSFYDNAGFSPTELQSFEDLAEIPIVSKTLLKSFALEDRSTLSRGRLLLNTGGTSGQPFSFYVDRNAFARHFAHYHLTWKRLGYTPADVKLTFRGKNLSNKGLHYNAVHNELYVNAYCSYAQICAEISSNLERIRYIHGYPSAIYQFVKYCVEHNQDLLGQLRVKVKGIFFDSEFPSPSYRNLIEDHLTPNTLACYCHSEMSLMAFEIERNVYKPYQTYGFCEAIASSNGHSLVGTSYGNHVSPFLRYDTGDLIKPVSVVEGILEAFEIEDGRIGDFIEDKHGKRISLTAFIFGRHHKVFDFADFIQVRQIKPGTADIILTANSGTDVNSFRALVDLTNVDIDFNFVIVSAPFRTRAGKVPLLVTDELFKS